MSARLLQHQQTPTARSVGVASSSSLLCRNHSRLHTLHRRRMLSDTLANFRCAARLLLLPSSCYTVRLDLKLCSDVSQAFESWLMLHGCACELAVTRIWTTAPQLLLPPQQHNPAFAAMQRHALHARCWIVNWKVS
jgi:hypothetical protein